MLYETTRSKLNTYTNIWAMREERAADGGFFVPAQLPHFSVRELWALKDGTAGDAVALILNQFFSCRLTGRDVEFVLGRNFCNLTQLNNRTRIAELWRNPDGDASWITNRLTRLVGEENRVTVPGEWMRMVVRIGVLFAIFAELFRKGAMRPDGAMDLAVLTGDFSEPMAAWYARKMGLPIGDIICCCNENGSVWDLLRRGRMKTDAPVVNTELPLCDHQVPEGLERLIYCTLGRTEVAEFLFLKEEGDPYSLNPEQYRRLREGLFATVVWGKRVKSTIPNVYSTSRYVLSPYSALAYAGLMDYRSVTGKNTPALILGQRSPIHEKEYVMAAMGVDEKELRRRLNLL